MISDNKKIIDSKEFIKEIEKIVRNTKTDYMDAVVHYCEGRGIEIETAAAIIKSNPMIKAKIQNEAETLNYIPRTAKLPI